MLFFVGHNRIEIVVLYKILPLMKPKSDFVFISILGLLIIYTIWQSVVDDYVLNINHYLAFACWIVVLYFRIAKPRAGRYGVPLLLVLGTLNVFNFFYWRQSTTISIGEVSSPGFDVNLFLVLIAYYIVNFQSVNNLILKLFRGSDAERQEVHKKQIAFYLKKFEACNADELQKIYADLKSYPPEAQIALQQMQAKIIEI
jgi:DNA-directed RNA polymerase subunit F